MVEGSGHVLIIANLAKEGAAILAKSLETRLAALGFKTRLFGFTGIPEKPPSMDDCALVISLGGDGTVLYSARCAAPAGLPILPFNLGRLGFIAAFNRDDWEPALEACLAGRLPLSPRIMLSISLESADGTSRSLIALNDAAIASHGIAKLIALDVVIAGSVLGTYRSDGVLVATPTGSTAYNLAAGGPVLSPEMDAMVVNAICPFTLWNRPLVLPGRERIEVIVKEGSRTGTMLSVDGQESFTLAPGDRIFVSHYDKKALIYLPSERSFYELLKTKFSWSGGPDA